MLTFLYSKQIFTKKIHSSTWTLVRELNKTLILLGIKCVDTFLFGIIKNALRHVFHFYRFCDMEDI